MLSNLPKRMLGTPAPWWLRNGATVWAFPQKDVIAASLSQYCEHLSLQDKQVITSVATIFNGSYDSLHTLEGTVASIVARTHPEKPLCPAHHLRITQQIVSGLLHCSMTHSQEKR